jgi:2-methylisocitrate lyase-like PEP mutase family enzyme
MGYGDALRDEVRRDNVTPLIGIFDMYSASVAAQNYGGMFVSGFGFAAS